MMASSSNQERIRLGVFSSVPERVPKLSRMFQHSSVDGVFDLSLIQGAMDEILPAQTLHCLVVDLEGSPRTVDLIGQVRACCPSIAVMIIDSKCAGDQVVKAVLAGARGCISPESDSIAAFQAVKDVLEGLYSFSPKVMSTVIDRLLEMHRSSRSKGSVANS